MSRPSSRSETKDQKESPKKMAEQCKEEGNTTEKIPEMFLKKTDAIGTTKTGSKD